MQPDVTKVGGISEQRRIAWMAYDFVVKYVGHGWNTALGVAADLQMASTFPTAEQVVVVDRNATVGEIRLETSAELEAGRAWSGEIRPTNSETVGSQSHSLRQRL